MKSQYHSFIAVGIVSLLLSLIYCPPYDIYFDDKEIFKYSGFLIRNGEVPYKDFFDHKPPLIFFLNAFGSLFGSWGLWIVDTVLVLLVSLQFTRLNLTYGVRFPAILAILFNLILRHPNISFGVGMTREYTTILLLVAFCVILGTSRYKYFYLGLLGALIFFMQQEQVVILVPIVVYSIWCEITQGQRKFFPVVSSALLGCFTVIGPIIIYFLLNDALQDFWNNAFAFNTRWYTREEKPGLIRQIITLKNYVYQLNLDTLLIGALAMGIAGYFIGHTRKGLLIVCLITIPASFISEFLSGKLTIGNASCQYYLLPLAATIPFLLFVVFAFTERQVFQKRIHQIIYSILFLAGLVMSIAMYVVNYGKYPHHGIAKSAEIKYLTTKEVKDYQLYVFNNSNYIYAYNRFEVLPPSKWLYHYFWSWYPDWDIDARMISSITDDLRKHRTRYVIYSPGTMQFLQAKNRQVWEHFLAAYYKPVPGLQIWELK